MVPPSRSSSRWCSCQQCQALVPPAPPTAASVFRRTYQQQQHHLGFNSPEGNQLSQSADWGDWQFHARPRGGGSVFRHSPYHRYQPPQQQQQQQQQRSYYSGSSSSSSSSRNAVETNRASPASRRWKHFPQDQQQDQQQQQQNDHRNLDLRIVSYNILAQCHLEFNRHLYSHVRRADWLSWPLRSVNILADIRALRPDLLCLQEVEPAAYATFFEPELHQLGYAGSFLAKTGKGLDGCATFWRRDLFHLETYSPVEFFAQRPACMAYHNVAQLAVLSCRAAPSCRLAVANTHLLFNPNRGDAKLLQATALLATLASKVAPGTPLVLCGDLNAQPESALFRLFLRGSLRLDDLLISDVSLQNATSFLRRRSQSLIDPTVVTQAGLTGDCKFLSQQDSIAAAAAAASASPLLPPPPPPLELRHSIGLQSAYDYRNSDDLFTVTSYTAHDTCTVDAIFYAAGSSNQLRCLAQLDLLTPLQLNRIGGIPNGLQSSDHLPLCAKFRWRLDDHDGDRDNNGSCSASKL